VNRATEISAAVLDLLGRSPVRRTLRRTRRRLPELAELTDDELRERCRALLGGPKVRRAVPLTPLQSLKGFELGDGDAEALALCAEAFSRFPPAGLAAGSRLHPEQLLGAAQMLRGAMVQMDTGEGKTFSILAAAFALLRLHGTVYVMTANPYLAARDAAQAAPFWTAMGIAVGCGQPPVYEPDDGEEVERSWRARVVYTTLGAVTVRSLHEDCGGGDSQLDFSAVLLDEADALLLDQSYTRFQLMRASDASTKDWSRAIHIARALSEEDVVVEELPAPSTRLTPLGEAKAITLADAEAMRPADRLLVLHDVEVAHTAIRVVADDHHYHVRSGRAIPVDPSSGWRKPETTPSWIAPLERHLGLPGRPRTTVTHITDGLTVLRRFARISGCSGTVVGESLNYMLLLGLPPAVIPPRRQRHQGRLPDLLAKTREHAHRWVAEQVAEQGARRPILIATDSTAEALEIAERLTAMRIEGVRVRAVSDETIASEQLFETAGRPGTTIVSTRVSGRGVDIPLTPEARANGGMALIAVGHAEEARLDRQLLGRVGRQGDPYTARFITHPDDALLSERVNRRALEASFSLAGDQVLVSSQFNRRMASLQRLQSRRRLQRFAHRVATHAADRSAFDMLREWQRASGPNGSDDVPDAFLTFLAERYITRRFPGLSAQSQATFAAPERVAAELTALTGRPDDELKLTVGAAGESEETAHRVFVDYLVETLAVAARENASARRELRRRSELAERAVLDVRLATFARDILHEAGPSATGAMRAALAAGVDGQRVSLDAVAERIDEIGSVLDTDAGRSGDARDGDSARLVHLTVAAAEAAGRQNEAAELDSAIEELAGARRTAADLDERWARWATRTPRAVAQETVARAAERLTAGVDRCDFQVRQTVGPARRASAYQSRMEDLRLEIETTLATELCANLAACADPSRLDTLFLEHDRKVATTTTRLRLELPALPAPDALPPAGDVPEQGSEIEVLLAAYVDVACPDAGDGEARDRHDLYRELKLLVGDDMGALSDPDRVKAGYDRWKGGMRERVPPWGWRRLDRHAKDFLGFLTDRGLVAPMPAGLTERSRSWSRRVRREATSPGVVLALLALAAGALLALVLAAVPHPSDGLALGDGWQLLDRMLTGGALSGGSALGALLLGLVGGAWVRWLSGSAAEASGGEASLERLASAALIVAGTLLVVQPWSAGTLWLLAVGIVGWLALAAVTTVARNFAYLFEQLAKFPLTALLAATLAGASALPLLVQLGGDAHVLAAAAGMAALLACSMPLRRARMRVVALQASDEDGRAHGALRVPLTVRARLPIAAHAFALLFAWAVSCVLLGNVDAVARSLSAGGVYLVVLGLWARALARSGADVEAWQSQMRQHDQAYAPTPSAPTLPDALRLARRRVLAAELAIAVTLVTIGTLVSLEAPAAILSELPVGMATVFVVAVTVDLVRGVGRGLRSPLTGLVEPSSARYDEVIGANVYATQTLRHLRRQMHIGAVVVGVTAITDALDVVQMLVDAYQWLERLVA
jgi:preprotein translocase subunit SecA